MASVFQRALESRPDVATRGGAGQGGGERVDVPTCAKCGAPREREREREDGDERLCRYCGEGM